MTDTMSHPACAVYSNFVAKRPFIYDDFNPKLRQLESACFLAILCASYLISIACGLVISRTGNATFDYVIVGGGNAGLAIASRLSEQPLVRAAVIEAGDYYESTSGNFSGIPANDVYYNGKDGKDTNPLLDWSFTTTTQEGFNDEVARKDGT